VLLNTERENHAATNTRLQTEINAHTETKTILQANSVEHGNTKTLYNDQTVLLNTERENHAATNTRLQTEINAHTETKKQIPTIDPKAPLSTNIYILCIAISGIVITFVGTCFTQNRTAGLGGCGMLCLWEYFKNTFDNIYLSVPEAWKTEFLRDYGAYCMAIIFTISIISMFVAWLHWRNVFQRTEKAAQYTTALHVLFAVADANSRQITYDVPGHAKKLQPELMSCMEWLYTRYTQAKDWTAEDETQVIMCVKTSRECLLACDNCPDGVAKIMLQIATKQWFDYIRRIVTRDIKPTLFQMSGKQKEGMKELWAILSTHATGGCSHEQAVGMVDPTEWAAN
jgi:hypothetical protein